MRRRWLARAAFILAFVPVHVLSMALSYNCAVNKLWPKVCNVIPLVLSFPLFRLLMQFDPDGDRTPVWFHYTVAALNAVLWAIATLLVLHLTGRLRRDRTVRESRVNG